MFSWGKESRRGFRLSDGSYGSGPGRGSDVSFLDLDFQIKELSAGLHALSFIKSNGNPFICFSEKKGEGRVRGKQKYVDIKEKIQAVSCSDHMVFLLSKKGHVFSVDATRPAATPRTMAAFSRLTVSQVACGSKHSVALTKGGQVYTWGLNSKGQLGLGTDEPTVPSPQLVRGLCTVPLLQVAAGGEQSFSLSVSGSVFSWGRNHLGQLGLGHTGDRHTPTHVQSLNMKKTVHISCGEEHTAVLTKDGAVFTFGSGHYGQLGHNSFRDELRPRLVAELWGSKVTQVACGRHHTLVMTDSKNIYSFGCGEQGQLGRGKEADAAVPLPVQLPHGHLKRSNIRNIFAGGNCSFATCTSEDDNEESNSVLVTQLSVEDMINKWTSEHDSESWKNTKQQIQRTFSSASALNKSFLNKSRDKHFQTSSKFCGLDFTAVQRAFAKLRNKDKVLTQVEVSLIHMVPNLDLNPVGMEGLRIYLLLNELLHVVQEHKPSSELVQAVAAAVGRLSADSLQVLGDWWSSLSDSIRVKHVEVWKKALSVLMSPQTPPPTDDVENLLLILQYMYNANSRMAGSKRLPETTFCVRFSEALLQQEVHLWYTEQVFGVWSVCESSILCQFTSLMDLQSKKEAFDLLATSVMQYQHLLDPNPRFFDLKLRRAMLLHDTFQQLAAAPPNVFFKPLMVYFDGDPTVTNVYKRDFFHHLFPEMLSTDSKMFTFDDSKTLAWFPSTVREEDKQKFFAFGILCGLALFNQSIIHLPFPLVLFKKLLDVKPSLEDLTELSPRVGQSLQYVLDFEGDVEDLDMSFKISWDGEEVDLDANNPEKPLTNENKKEFVGAYVDHVFNTSVDEAFQEFKEGFFQVCDRKAVKLFKPEELQRVLVGEDHYDWTKLKQNTLYEFWYHDNHPVILKFWEVFDELSEDQKKDFLWFVTGFRKAPILGLGQIQLKIRMKLIQTWCVDQYFPESLTCHYILYLPSYSSKKILRARLTEAIKTDRGFV